MTTDFKIYYIKLTKSDVPATRDVDRRLYGTKVLHKYRGEQCWLIVCSSEPDIPNALPVSDSFIHDNKDDFIEAATDASDLNKWGAYTEYERLAARNELKWVLNKCRESHGKVKREFLESLKYDLIEIKEKIDALYCHGETSGLSLGILCLHVDLDGISKRGELKADRNPKILRSLMFHRRAIGAKTGILDDIRQSLLKAIQSRDVDHFVVVYDGLDDLRNEVQKQIMSLEGDLQHIDQSLSETSTLVDGAPPLENQLSNVANNFLERSLLYTNSVVPSYENAEEKVVNLSAGIPNLSKPEVELCPEESCSPKGEVDCRTGQRRKRRDTDQDNVMEKRQKL